MLANLWIKHACHRLTCSMRSKQVPQKVMKNKYRQYSHEALANAFNAVRTGECNMNQASLKYKVPEATLRHRLSGAVNPNCTKSGPPPLLSKETEETLVNHVKLMSRIGFDYNREEIVDIASQYAAYLGVREDQKPLSKKWFYSMKTRWPDVPTAGKQQTLELSKIKSRSPSILSSYFSELECMLKENKLIDRPDCIYIVDEKVVEVIDSLHSSTLSSPSVSVTILGSGNANGTHIPPYFVFPGKCMREKLLAGGTAGTAGEVTATGLIDSQLFQGYLESHFLKHAIGRATKGQPILMLYDGHKTHVSLSTIEWAKNHNIFLFVLPLHMSYIFRPDGDTSFGQLDTLYDAQCEDNTRCNPNSKITISNICEIASKAYVKALSSENLKYGFKERGIFPLSKQIFTDNAEQLIWKDAKVPHTAQKRKLISTRISKKPVKKLRQQKNKLIGRVLTPDNSDSEGTSSLDELLLSDDDDDDDKDPGERCEAVNSEKVANTHTMPEGAEGVMGVSIDDDPTYDVPPQDVLLDLFSPHLLGACETVISTMNNEATSKTETTGEESVSGASTTDGGYSMAFITVPDMAVAKKLSHGLVQNRLAACVNIIPAITSVYEWEGKVNEDPELLLMVKTSTAKVDDVSQFIRENHPYEVAEVISSKIDNGNPPYLKWLGEMVSGPPIKK